MSKVIIYTDGASKGNPGDAGIGVLIQDEKGNTLHEIAEYIGKTTNNVAEYTALVVHGLTKAADMGATEVEIRTDSELLAFQLTGVYKVKSPLLAPLYTKVVSLLRHFKHAGVKHVRREFNRRADELANEGIKKHNNRLAEAKSESPTPIPISRPKGQGELEF